MSEKTDSLREIALNLTDDGTVTERQQESPSHDPVGEEEARIAAEASASARDDGLDDAVDGGGGGGVATG